MDKEKVTAEKTSSSGGGGGVVLHHRTPISAASHKSTFMSTIIELGDATFSCGHTAEADKYK